MNKWKKLFGLEYPEAFGKVEDPEDKSLRIFVMDLPKINHEILVLICQHLKIDISHLYNQYAKTTKQQLKEYGLK